MRIIGGVWRSRKLVRPATKLTRPIPDRVREAVFDMLGSRFDCPGAFPNWIVADVFAGSGSLGLEALSRGARACCFFERGRDAIKALKNNIETLEAQDNSHIVRLDAWRAAILTPNDEPFDLLFLDPPYRDSDEVSDRGRVRSYLRRLAENSSKRPTVILHHRRSANYDGRIDTPWTIVDYRIFGTNAITVIE